MSKGIVSQISVASVLFLCGLLLFPAASQAAFVSNNLIDDLTFNNVNTMSAGQIDAFLNERGSCISTNSGFSALDPIGYNVNQGYIYGNNVSAGVVVAHAAQAYDLNPQVLLTTLQKEQSLITSTSCSTNTISKAVGYACPDGGPAGGYSYTGLNLYARNGVTVTDVSGICVNNSAKAGFTQQLIRAAWLLKYSQQRALGNVDWAIIRGNWNNSDDLSSCYSGPMTEGYRKRCKSDSTAVYYDGYTIIDSTSTHMDTGATAALYRYTPHFHGNQSFDTIFNQYFGSQFANDTFSAHPDGTLISYNGVVYLVSNNTKQPVTAAAFDTNNYSWNRVKAASTGDASLSVGSTISTVPAGTLFTVGDGTVYVADYSGGALQKQWISAATFIDLGYTWSQIVNIPVSAAPPTTTPGYYTASRHPAGTLVKMNGGVYVLDQTSSHYLTLLAFNSNRYNWNNLVPATAADIALPKGANAEIAEGSILYSGGNIYLADNDGSGVIRRPIGPWECYANRLHYTTSDWYNISASDLPARSGSLFTC